MKSNRNFEILGLILLLGIGFMNVPLQAGQLTESSQSARQITSERFVPSADGLTVHDNLLHVTWLADGDFPASHKFDLPITDSGSMTYPTARKWVAALNADNRRAGYLGHNNWTLPATPTTDEACSVAKGPHGNSFGFNCMNSK